MSGWASPAHGLTYLFISHAVRHVSDRIAVMNLGRIVEVGPAPAVGSEPQMPYPQSLLSAVLSPHPAVERARERIVLRGAVPLPAAVVGTPAEAEGAAAAGGAVAAEGAGSAAR